MQTLSLYANVVAYLGGEAWLKQAGVRAYGTDSGHVSLKLLHPNPRCVSTVTITACPCNCYSIDCFGRLPPDSFRAPLVAQAAGGGGTSGFRARRTDRR